MKFDAVVGNPPYQEKNIGKNNQAMPVYHYFYDLAEQIGHRYCLISPARFLSKQGATPKSWNNKMLADVHVDVIYFNAESSEVFVGVDIKGGVVILYRDSVQDFGAIDTFIAFSELRSVFHKVIKISTDNLSHLVYSPDSHRLTDQLFVDHPECIGRTDKAHAKAVASSVFKRYPEIFYEHKPKDTDEYIQIYGRLAGERKYFWIKQHHIEPHPNLDKWKVFVPGANGSGRLGEVLSSPVVAGPSVGHNQTFVSLGSFATQFEAQALLKYIKTKFARAMLGIMKITQNNQSKNTWSKVPLQDFTPHSDIDWTQSVAEIDLQLYKKYKLDQTEIDFIENKVKPMD